MKLVVLSTRLSGYMAGCLQTFRQLTDADILLYAWPNQPDAPFDPSCFESLGKLHDRYDFADSDILKAISDFAPDAVLVSGWKDKGYVRICRQLKAAGIFVISGCDTQWKGSLRQKIAALVAPLHVRRFIDVLWTTGERQRYLARALGYTGESCWDGYYACDWERFSRSPQAQALATETSTIETDPYFLYVGRYAPEKGLDTLATAYRQYCQSVHTPWKLVCAGAGELGTALVAAGAEDRGFIQPSHLPALMQNAGAFVLPSRFEPWGVVVQEAAACGLPLILSDVCGAATHLLRPHYNGLSFSAGSVDGLVRSLKTMHSLSDQQRQAFAQASYELSKQYTPERWAKTLQQGIQLRQRQAQSVRQMSIPSTTYQSKPS